MKSTKDLMQEHLSYRLDLMEKLCNGILNEIKDCRTMLDVISDSSGYWERMDEYMKKLEEIYLPNTGEPPYPFNPVVTVYGCPNLDPVNYPNVFDLSGKNIDFTLMSDSEFTDIDLFAKGRNFDINLDQDK